MQSVQLDYFIENLYYQVVPSHTISLDKAIENLNDIIDICSLDFFGQYKSTFDISMRKSNIFGYDYNLVRFSHKSMYDFYIEVGYKEYKEKKNSQYLPALIVSDNLNYHLQRFRGSLVNLKYAVKDVESELNDILMKEVAETNLKICDTKAPFIYKLYKIESNLI